MRVLWVALTAALTLAACQTPGQMRNMNRAVNLHGYRSYSWGKAGVNFKDYSQVVFECTSRGVLARTDLHAPAFDIASSTVTEDFVISNATEAELAQQREDIAQRHAIIDSCLVEHGYSKFGLTDAQLARLDTLPRGSLERREYLHSLGSDPGVLHRQHI